LHAAKDTLAAKGTKTLLVIKNDKIVYEWYASGWRPVQRHYTASLAKALVGGVSLMFALNDGRLSIDEPACKYIPEWRGNPKKSKITIRHLATHSSGIEDAEQDEIPHFELPGWKGGFWKKDPDPFTLSRDKAPIIFPPGTKFAYSNPGMAMLSYVVTTSLQGTEHTDVRTLLRERIMRPIGVKDDEWSIGYGQTYKVNGLNLIANWGGGSYTARAVARVGRLMLRKGNWQGRQLIDSKCVEEVVKYAGTPLPDRPAGEPNPGSGLGWWTNFDGVWAKVPRDAFGGAGAGNQVLLVVPSLDLIIVRNGSNLYNPSKGEGFWGGLEKYLFNPLMEAIIKPPYSRSGLITKVNFEPASSIVRKAKGSDNWPITWADDDNQYTAYGDGWGFEPKTKKKLSLGIAKITGSPPDFRGVNIRTDTGERIGQGAEGAKASGIICVDGVLYMLVRNTGNSQVAWSEDHGKSWKWCGWKFTTSFGAPTFLNYGRNYAGARDNFVYLYSHDSNSAYEPADRMVMARVPKEAIRKRNTYEFFNGFDDWRQPMWTSDIREMKAVFINPGRCYRSGISYNAGLKRYLWCQTIYGKDDMRFKGGLGIFDAPEPWGPWTTVYYNQQWDVGPGETSCLPARWMSKDGRSCYLLFSGDDCFSVRKAAFHINDN
ncbi:MAG: serine hydrolase, partial [Planctomycetes bacterium]|nr:serine hydrolase [Planctomycetota bacterium]